jgi:hypothetical protein
MQALTTFCPLLLYGKKYIVVLCAALKKLSSFRDPLYTAKEREVGRSH